jgi:hypothetical protein
MTNIYGVDASLQAWQQDNQRPPAKDFAHELAKRDEPVKTAPQNDAKPNPDAEFEGQSSTQPGKSASIPLPGDETAALSAQEALAAVQSEAQQLAQATVTPTGVTEALLGARVFGWHAMAQAYLSELTAADGGTTAHALSEEQVMSSAQSVPDDSAEALAASEPSTAAVVDTSTATAPVQAANPTQARLATDEAVSPGTADMALADVAAPSYWSERSIRFTRQGNGASVAWLRDFRISHTEASHLIQFVLNDAKAKGVVLSKIMLNGREAWASPNNH